MAKPLLSKSLCRTSLTVALYLGVLLFLLPYLTGRVFTGVLVIILGASLAVVAGLARCYLTEGDCTERDHIKQHIP
jgi:hypothetical protein